MNKPVVLFDGVCNLCNGAVQFIITHDKKEKFLFASLQSETGQQLLKKFNLPVNDFNSFILIENNNFFSRSTGALKVVRKLNALWPLLYGLIIVPKFLRDGIYNWVSKNRYRWFGKKESCMIPTPALKARFLN